MCVYLWNFPHTLVTRLPLMIKAATGNNNNNNSRIITVLIHSHSLISACVIQTQNFSLRSSLCHNLCVRVWTCVSFIIVWINFFHNVTFFYALSVRHIRNIFLHSVFTIFWYLRCLSAMMWNTTTFDHFGVAHQFDFAKRTFIAFLIAVFHQ